MSALAHSAGARLAGFEGRALVRSLLARGAGLIGWRQVGLFVACALLASAGSLLNEGLDFPVLRAQIAIACGALAASLTLAERWSSEPDHIGKGCALAAAISFATGAASLL